MYKGINSIIKENERIQNNHFIYTIIKTLNLGMSNTYLAKDQYNKEVVIKQFKQKDKQFKQNQKIIFNYIKGIHDNDKNFSWLIEYSFAQFEFAGYFLKYNLK